jgi:ribosome maturation factor RimP
MNLDSLSKRIESIIAPSVEANGYDLVRVLYIPRKENPQLQIMIEHKDNTGMTVDDCAELSRMISVLLDVEDPIDGHYLLEISSPGIDRPVVKLLDYERFKGHIAKIETNELIEGRKHFQAELRGLENEYVLFKFEEQSYRVPFEEIHRCKLILTDELIAASLGKQKKRSENDT